MDQMNSSSLLLNDSDLNLSMSLCQWDGFQLSSEENANDHLTDASVVDKDVSGPISPKIVGEKETETLEVVREFLLEKTSQFYNDVINAQGEKSDKTGLSLDSLRERYELLRRQTADVVGRFQTTTIEQELNNRFKSIDAALKQLSIMKTPVTATLSLSSSDSGRSSTDEFGLANSSPLHQWRRWVETVEAKMICQKIDWRDRESLEQLLKVQQALQDRIQREGPLLVALVQKHNNAALSSHRCRVASSSIEKRWHGLWLKSLEWQYKLEKQIHGLTMGDKNLANEDTDVTEPVAKRRRLNEKFINSELDKEHDDPEQISTLDDVCSATSDTIPFSENEYEPLTPRSLAPSRQEDEPISARDCGYSSASSAVVAGFDLEKSEDEKPSQLTVIDKHQSRSEASSPCLDRRTRIENSPPIEYFYQMTPSTPEDPKPMTFSTPFPQKKKPAAPLPDDAIYVYTQQINLPPAELTDSLLVNVGDTMSESFDNGNGEENSDDLEEILNLLRQGGDSGTFENELDELLLRRQGTVWVPLAHDEEIEDERREQNTTPIANIVEKSPPHTPFFASPIFQLTRISSSGSLKRRRQENCRRPVPTSFTMPAISKSGKREDRYSESAVVNTDTIDGMELNMSASWHPSTPSPPGHDHLSLNNSRSERKKLRASRIRRSWSYSINANSMTRSIIGDFQSGKASPSRPNTAVSNLDDCSKTDDEAFNGSVPEFGSSFMTGGGEMMAEESDCAIGPTVLMNPPVWQWDDYKPPNHNEDGPIDQSPLDDSMFTAFGDDDYCSYLDQPSPRTPEISSFSNNYSLFELSARLSPVGMSCHSDLGEVGHLIKDSEEKLRVTRNAMKQFQSRGTMTDDGSEIVDLLTTCQQNVERLEFILGSSMLAEREFNKEAQILAISNLVQDWRDLALLLTRLVFESPPASVAVSERRRSSEEEERFVDKLRKEMQRLTTSLQEIIAQGAILNQSADNNTTPNGSNVYQSLDQTQEIFDLLQAVRRSLTADKIRLNLILHDYNTSVKLFSMRCEAIGDEIMQLRSYFESAYESCDAQLRELESMRYQWSNWQQTERLCGQILEKINSSLDAHDFKALQSNLAILEDRVSQLERTLEQLLVYSNSHSTTVVSIGQLSAADLMQRTEFIRGEFDTLKSKFSEDRHFDSDILSSSGDELNDESKLRNRNKPKKRKRSNSRSPKVDSHKGTDVMQVEERTRSTSFRRLLRRSWPMTLCICVLICLNLFFFYPSCCDNLNRYWWSFGPKTHYSHGPPPT